MGFFDSIYLERYADLLLRFGVKLEKGQVLLLELPQEQVEFAEAIRKVALMMGAGDVIIFHNDIHTELARLKATAKNGKMTVPSEQAAVMQKCLAENGASLSLMSPYPRTMTMLSDEERKIWSQYQNDLRNIVREAIQKKRIHWCYACVPNAEWATQVYPELPEKDALSQMWRTMMNLCLVRGDNDPVEAWLTTYEKVAAQAQRLNDLPLRAVHLTTGLGTDVTIGVHENCIWEGGLTRTDYSKGAFQPNIPSYEICTTTRRSIASGTVVASYPLNVNGSIITGLSLSFENGRVCRFDAKEGLDVLREIVEHDEGSAYLGEIAFLEADLPIAQTKRLFYNTLLDENASCHIALGMGFPGNIRGIDPRDEETAKACDVNFSAYHVDIMFGTEDVCAEGICVDGKIVSIMQNGKFVL